MPEPIYTCDIKKQGGDLVKMLFFYPSNLLIKASFNSHRKDIQAQNFFEQSGVLTSFGSHIKHPYQDTFAMVNIFILFLFLFLPSTSPIKEKLQCVLIIIK